MANASTTNDTAPIAWAGSKTVAGKPKPVALVANAIARKSAFHIGKGFEPISPITTMIPDTSATRLSAVCKAVKVARFAIMMPSPMWCRRHQFRLTAFGFGGFDIAFDLDAFRVKQE